MLRLRALITGFCLAAAFAPPAGAQSPDVSETLELCVSCHGDGVPPEDPLIPIIAGQEYYYLYVQLRDYAAGRRENEIMSGIVVDLSKDEMKALAQHFSEQTWPETGFGASGESKLRGATAASAGQCPQCHLGGYNGNSRVPRLAGQTPTYLKATMLDFKYDRRNNAPDKSSLLESFPDEDIAAMAEFLAGF
jgi:cytochrome c553